MQRDSEKPYPHILHNIRLHCIKYQAQAPLVIHFQCKLKQYRGQHSLRIPFVNLHKKQTQETISTYYTETHYCQKSYPETCIWHCKKLRFTEDYTFTSFNLRMKQYRGLQTHAICKPTQETISRNNLHLLHTDTLLSKVLSRNMYLAL